MKLPKDFWKFLINDIIIIFIVILLLITFFIINFIVNIGFDPDWAIKLIESFNRLRS